jgi:hypothetical protein
LELAQYSGKTADQKYSEILKAIYFLPKQTKALLPGYHKAILITDLDLTKDPGMLYHRQLAYFLYPIDIRDIHRHEIPDLILIFFKRDAISHIPNGYTPYHIFNTENLIAVKQK